METLKSNFGKKILFSIFIIFAIRLMAQIPLIGITSDAIKKLYLSTTFGETIGIMSGGLIQTASVVALGIGPYITSSIIIQLTGMLYPRFNEVIGNDIEGKLIKNGIVRILTLIFSIFNGYIIYLGLNSAGLIGNLSTLEIITTLSTMAFGALFIMYLAELTSEMGVGGGSGLIITIGVISGLPYALINDIEKVGVGITLFGILINVIVIILTVFAYQAYKKVPLMFKNRQILKGQNAPYIPVKPLGLGVMPVIIASTLIGLPFAFLQYGLINPNTPPVLLNIFNLIMNTLDNPFSFLIIQFIAIVYFAMVYERMAFREQNIANNLKNQGQYVLGIKPGGETHAYFKKISEKMAFLGGIYLATLVTISSLLVLTGITPSLILSGTGVIILVGSVLDFKSKWDAERNKKKMNKNV